MATDTELAWAAGFFDGEGTTCYVNTGRNERMISMSVGQASTDGKCPEVLTRLYGIVGGSIYGPIQQNARWKPKYTWQVTGRARVVSVYTVLEPYLGTVKKQQYRRSLKSFDEHLTALSDGLCRKDLHKMEGDNVGHQMSRGKQSRYCKACKAEADADKATRGRIARILIDRAS